MLQFHAVRAHSSDETANALQLILRQRVESASTAMVLVTGGTGFIGRVVLRQLAEAGVQVRSLLRPSRSSPNLPRGVSLDVALASLSDPRGVRAALVGIETVIHLAGAERWGDERRLLRTDVLGTENLALACAEAGVQGLIYLSHIGADRASAYPAMRAKAAAEEAIRRSGVPHTILRSALVYGSEDRFTTSIAMMLALSPGIFFLPGDGSTLTQPIGVRDLSTCIVWALEDGWTQGQTHEIGGPEFLSFAEVVDLVMQRSGSRRFLLTARQPYLKAGAWLMSRLLRYSPLTPFWLDYLAVNRMAGLDNLPRAFGLQPARMETQLEYLATKNWAWEFFKRQLSPRSGRW